jgi:hypothetical protein
VMVDPINSPQVDHTFAASGTNYASLVVTDAAGRRASRRRRDRHRKRAPDGDHRIARRGHHRGARGP